MIRDYYERIGVQVVATITGDGRIDAIRRAHGAALNVVQCAGSMIHLAHGYGLGTRYGHLSRVAVVPPLLALEMVTDL